MGHYVCAQCGAAHDKKPETDADDKLARFGTTQILTDPAPGPDNLATVMEKADISAVRGVIKRRGIIAAYTMMFNECTDEQLAMLLQHQVRFFEALSRDEDGKEKRGGGRIKMVPPDREG